MSKIFEAKWRIWDTSKGISYQASVMTPSMSKSKRVFKDFRHILNIIIEILILWFMLMFFR